MNIYVDGNAARQLEEMPRRLYIDEDERERKRRKARALEKRAAAVRRQNSFIRAAVGMMVASVVLFLVILLLNGSVKSNALMTEIRDLEKEYNTIVSQNDSKEYDINRSVDLNTVIRTATEEYGMVRGNVDQIITYRTDDSEYIQQLAEIPHN